MSKADYLEFFKNVYGAETLVLPKREDTTTTMAVALERQFEFCYQSGAHILFVTPMSADEYKGDFKNLLEKMVAAMGLSLDSIGLFFNGQIDPQFKPEICIYLDENREGLELGEWSEVDGGLCLKTNSLSSLNQFAELKKMTWKHLQMVMSKIKIH